MGGLVVCGADRWKVRKGTQPCGEVKRAQRPLEGAVVGAEGDHSSQAAEGSAAWGSGGIIGEVEPGGDGDVVGVG